MTGSPTIQISFTPEAQAVLRRFDGQQFPKRVARGIARGLDQANWETVGIIQKEFLSYPKDGPVVPEGLRTITNRLRGSIRATRAVATATGVEGHIGSNVKYAAVHEFGFTGTVNIPQHTRTAPRQFLLGGKIVSQASAERQNLLTKAGKVRKKSNAAEIHPDNVGRIEVRAHSRKMNLPARAYVRRGIIRNLDRTKQLISQGIITEVST